MYLIDLINSSRIDGFYFMTIKVEDFWLLAVALGVLVASVPFLANRPQPVPNWSRR